jgi:hypothetical protein
MTTIYIAARYSTKTDFALFGPYASESEARCSAEQGVYSGLGFTQAFDIGGILERHEGSESQAAAPDDTKTYYCFSNREVELPEEIKTKLSIKNGDTNCWDSIHSASDSSISEEEMIIGILNHLEREYQSVLIVKERETGAIDALLKIGVFDRVCHAKGDTSRDTLLKLKRWTKKTSSAVARRKWPDAQDAVDIEVEFWQKFVVDGSSGPVDDGESDSHWTGQSY